MCCRKNRHAYTVLVANASNRAGNHMVCNPRRRPRREGLIRMIVRAIIERHEAKTAELTATDAGMAKDTKAMAAYELGYQNALKEHKTTEGDWEKSEGDEEERGQALSDSGIEGVSSIHGPPPRYELVQRS